MQHQIKVSIIGVGGEGTSILKVAMLLSSIKILGVCDINPDAPGMKLAAENGIYTTTDFMELLAKGQVDLIIEATGTKKVRQMMRRLKTDNTVIMDAQTAVFTLRLIQKTEKFLKIDETKEQLAVILNSAQEGVQVANAKGTITYINKAFTKITGLEPIERINKNVFDVSPEGALAEVLESNKAVFGKRNTIKGREVEVVSNASPIIVDGDMTGAVVVFRDITDIKKMAKRLEDSNRMIKSLKRKVKQLASAKYTFNDLIGKNTEFLQSISIARRAAFSDSTVLLCGESGTGKELFAHAIHSYSPRVSSPFVKINCAAIPENLLESELFGYEKGAFTGANKTKIGKFELAHGGSIFLDEIGDLNIYLQAKILRALQEKEVERVGGNQVIKVNVRVIAATNHDLEELVSNNLFRKDLFYRLNVININIPPLRERQDDILLLADFLIKKLNRRLGKKVEEITPEAKAMLVAYKWPGNIRELENILERSIALADNKAITANDLKFYLQRSSSSGTDEILSLSEMEKKTILEAMDKYGYSLEGKKMAAEKLNISLATLYNKLKKY